MKPQDQIITDKEAVRKAKCMPNSAPDSCLEPLKPIGESKFKGDGITIASWSVDDKFTKGTAYPVYDSDGMDIVVGNDGKGYKMTPTAWTKVKYY